MVTRARRRAAPGREESARGRDRGRLALAMPDVRIAVLEFQDDLQLLVSEVIPSAQSTDAGEQDQTERVDDRTKIAIRSLAEYMSDAMNNRK